MLFQEGISKSLWAVLRDLKFFITLCLWFYCAWGAKESSLNLMAHVLQEQATWEQIEAYIWDDDADALQSYVEDGFASVHVTRRSGFLLEVGSAIMTGTQ